MASRIAGSATVRAVKGRRTLPTRAALVLVSILIIIYNVMYGIIFILKIFSNVICFFTFVFRHLMLLKKLKKFCKINLNM